MSEQTSYCTAVGTAGACIYEAGHSGDHLHINAFGREHRWTPIEGDGMTDIQREIADATPEQMERLADAVLGSATPSPAAPTREPECTCASLEHTTEPCPVHNDYETYACEYDPPTINPEDSPMRNATTVPSSIGFTDCVTCGALHSPLDACPPPSAPPVAGPTDTERLDLLDHYGAGKFKRVRTLDGLGHEWLLTWDAEDQQRFPNLRAALDAFRASFSTATEFPSA